MDERRIQAGRNRKVKYAASVKTIMPRSTGGMCEPGTVCGGIRRPTDRDILKDSTIDAVDNPSRYEHNCIYTPSGLDPHDVWPRNPAIPKLKRSSARPPCILTPSTSPTTCL